MCLRKDLNQLRVENGERVNSIEKESIQLAMFNGA